MRDRGNKVSEQEVSKKVNEGLDFLSRKKEFDERKVDQYNELGDEFMQKEDLPKALSNYKRALALDKENPLTIMNIGTVYYAMEEYDAAIESLNDAKEIVNSQIEISVRQKDGRLQELRDLAGAIYANVANIYYSLDDLDNAKRNYLMAIKNGVKNYLIYNCLADIYIAQDKKRIAVKCYVKSVKLEPGNFEATIGLAEYCLDIKEFDMAKQLAQDALSTANNDDEREYTKSLLEKIAKDKKENKVIKMKRK